MLSLKPEIQAITIYSDRALVNRACPINLEAGQQKVIVHDLPRRFQSDSLKLQIPSVEIIGLQTEAIYVANTEENPIDRDGLRTEKQQLQAELLEIDLDLEIQEEAIRQLFKLGDALNQALGTVIAAGDKAVDDALAMQNSQQAAYQKIIRQKQQLNQRKQEVQARIKEIEELLNKPRSGSRFGSNREIQHYQLHLEVQVKAPITSQLHMSYLVDNVRWQAEYRMDLQAQEVRLTYGARIYQNTGEDWPALKLKLSTAQLNKTAVIPRIGVWEINQISSESIEKEIKNRFTKATEKPQESNQSVIMTKTLYRPDEIRKEEAERAKVETLGQAAVVDFETLEALAIIADKETVFVLAEFDLPATYDYVAVPKVDNQAVYRAKIYNTSAYTLLAGKLILQENGAVLSKTTMPRTSSGEEIEYPLFYEERIKLRRFLKEQIVFLLDENTRQSRYRYKIQVENLLDMPVNLTLRDAMPVSLHPDIKVELLESQPTPYEITERGILKWVLELAAFEQQELSFEFTVTNPKEFLLSGIV